MELGKTYQLERKVSKLKLFFVCIILFLIIAFSALGFSFVSFVLSVLFFLKIYRVFIQFKSLPNFYKIDKGESENGNKKISFYDSKRKLLIEDYLTSYSFYEERSGMFEIEHTDLKKNLILVLEGNAKRMYDFLKTEDLKIKTPKRIGGFWEILELIFMP